MPTTLTPSLNSKTKISHAILIAGLIFFACRFFLAWIFFTEKMLSEDAPFYIVKMIQHSALLCEHYRYSVFLFQWIPFSVFKCGASLEFVTRIYSVSFEIYYLALFLFTLLVAKNNSGALLIFLFLSLIVGRDFFYPANESQLAIATSLTLFGLPFGGEKNNFKRAMIFGLPIIIISLNFHPIAILSLGFLLFFQIINSENKNRKPFVFLLVLAIAGWLLRNTIVPLDNYEANKMKSWTSLLNYIIHPNELPSLKSVIEYFYNYNIELILLFFFSLFLLMRKRRILQTVIVTGFIYFILVLFSVIKGADEIKIFNGEYFLLIGVPVLALLIPFIFIAVEKKYFLVSILFIPILISVYRINESAPFFRTRISYIERLIKNGNQFPEKRYIISSRNVPHEYIANTWPITFQTLLLSSFHHPDSAVTFIATKNMNDYDSLLKQPDYFLGPEWAIDLFDCADDKIRKEFFNLPSLGYRKLSSSQINFSDSIFNASNIKIYPVDSIVNCTKDSFVVAKLKIENSSASIIPSLPDASQIIFITYHLYDDGGKLIQWDNHRTPFETDVWKENLTGLIINTKSLQRGMYIIETDVVSENKRWWGINSRFRLSK